MTILKLPPFFKEILEEGFHVFNFRNAKIPNYYPNEFPKDYPGVKLKDLKKDDVITVKVLFLFSDGEAIQVESEDIDLEVVCIYDDDDSVVAEVMTELPDEIPLEKHDSLELYEEEILYKKTTRKTSCP